MLKAFMFWSKSRNEAVVIIASTYEIAADVLYSVHQQGDTNDDWIVEGNINCRERNSISALIC